MVGKRVRSRVDQRSSFLPSAALSLCARRLLWLQRIISATASRVVSQRARRWRCGKRRMYFYAYVEEDALESATHRAAVRSAAHGSPIRKGSVAWELWRCGGHRMVTRLLAFQHDDTIPHGTFVDGSVASYDPSRDGGGLGDVLAIVSRQAQGALRAGCRA